MHPSTKHCWMLFSECFFKYVNNHKVAEMKFKKQYVLSQNPVYNYCNNRMRRLCPQSAWINIDRTTYKTIRPEPTGDHN